MKFWAVGEGRSRAVLVEKKDRFRTDGGEGKDGKDSEDGG